MIQPYRNTPSVWSLCWVDVTEPLPIEGDFFLPTILILVGADFTPLAPPEILPELDQIHVEDWLARLLDELGVPSELHIWKAEEWIPEEWKFFGNEWKTRVKLVSPPPHEAQIRSDFSLPPAAHTPPQPISGNIVAAGLVRNSYRLRSQRKRTATFKKAAEIDPSNTEARIELFDIEFSGGHYNRCLKMAEEIEAIDSFYFQRRNVQWWENIATRPLLRALNGTMLCFWHLGRGSEAAEYGERLLKINPRDHLGVRFYVPLFLLLAGDNDSASAYFRWYAENYPKDMRNAWIGFAWALTLCLEGDDHAARKKYREAMLANIYIAPRLLGLRPPPEDIYHHSDRDEPQSAMEFFGSFSGLWEREPAAMRLLRETYEDMRPTLDKLVARRAAIFELMDHRYDPDYRENWTRTLDEEEAFIKETLDNED